MMKKFFPFVFAFVIALSSISVFALPSDDDGEENLSESSSDLSFYYSSVYDDFYRALLDSQFQNFDFVVTDLEIMPLYSLDNGTTPINSGFRSVLTSVIGNYSPVVVQYQYTNGTNTQYLREILPDYVWMISAGIFALLLYCTFRIGGSFLWRR